MRGRLDDFLREVAQDNKAGVSESDIQQSGLAATKRAYAIYKERGYEAVLLIAALRGPYHFTELAGGSRLATRSTSSSQASISRRSQTACTSPALLTK